MAAVCIVVAIAWLVSALIVWAACAAGAEQDDFDEQHLHIRRS